jgi:hypothetical protein
MVLHILGLARTFIIACGLAYALAWGPFFCALRFSHLGLGGGTIGVDKQATGVTSNARGRMIPGSRFRREVLSLQIVLEYARPGRSGTTARMPRSCVDRRSDEGRQYARRNWLQGLATILIATAASDLAR